jgi:DNA polymerase-4
VTAIDDRKILHLDLDAFYPSVEVLDNPELRGKAVIVGGIGPRGVVASASYEARELKVHSALPTTIAKRRCPDGVYLRPRFQRYRELSRQIFEIYRAWSDLVEPLSLDEAYIDVTHRPDSGRDIATQIRLEVREATGLTVSAGVAHNKFLAKLASDYDKPDGLTVITKAEARAFLAPLPVRRIWGVGPATAERLKAAGFATLDDVATSELEELRAVVGNAAERYQSYAVGHDRRTVAPRGEPSTISAETTFDQDIRSWQAAAPHVQRFAERISASLAKHDLWARTVVMKIRYGDFHTITRSQTTPAPIRERDDILAVARELARRADRKPSSGIRLIGLGVQNLRRAGDPDVAEGEATAVDQLGLF